MPTNSKIYAQEYYKRNKEKISRQRKIKYLIDEKYRKKCIAQATEYRKNHKDKALRATRKFYQEKINGKIKIGYAHGYKYLLYQGGKGVHRVIAEKALGRRLTSQEHVHHINGDTFDNRNCNLLICTNSYHIMLHRLMERKGIIPNERREG